MAVAVPEEKDTVAIVSIVIDRMASRKQPRRRPRGSSKISRLIDRYLFRECVRVFAGLCGLVLSILLIERLIRIIEIVSNSENGAVASFRMIVDLVPHYLQLAIPAALFLAIIISVDRLSRSSELVTMLSAGLSLRRLSSPFFLLAVMAAGATLLVMGFLQPLGRYDYRQTVNSIQTQSFRAAFQEGRFVRMDDLIVWTDFRDFAGRTLGETFILEALPDGGERYISAASGALMESRPGQVALQLENGNGATLAPPGQGGPTSTQALQFERLLWPVDSQVTPFRARGRDERELTLPELSDVSSFAGIRQTVASAAMHDQLSRAVLVLVLPLIAIPLGLNLGRHPRAGGIVTGVVILLIVQKTLEYGLQMAKTGVIPPWAGSWPVVTLTAFVGAAMFSHASGTSILSVARPREARNENLILTSQGQVG